MKPVAARLAAMTRQRLAALVLAATLTVAGVAGAGPAMGIIGGRDSTLLYPFMASIQHSGGTHFCGGSLIAPRWVVTAAHCVVFAEESQLTDLRVRIGGPDRTKGGTLTRVAAMFAHPEFTFESLPFHDIGLVKLDRPVWHRPVQIAPSQPTVGTTTRTLGWGCLYPHTVEHPCEPDTYPIRLQELDVRTVSGDLCEPAGFTSGLDVCVGPITPGSQPCGGDSGGPLLVRSGASWRLAGATSRGTGVEGQPPCTTGIGVFTNVTAYRWWLAHTMTES
jgi:secreted trypsin-like serine protease